MTDKQKKINVAVFPAGSEIGLEIHAALKNNKHFNVIGFTSYDDHSEFVYKDIEYVPTIDEPTFLSELNFKIEKLKIDLLFPAHDLFIDFIAENFHKIECKIVSHPYKTLLVCRSKLNTYTFFPDISPKLYPTEYPMFAKPDKGFGGKDSWVINGEAGRFKAEQSGHVICEYLPGKEYTVDCFTDSDGELILCHPRTRDRIKNGIAVRSSLIPDDVDVDQFWDIGNLINSRLKFTGAWFFQVKENKDGVLKLLEIAPRIAGTSGLTRYLAVNLPLISIWQSLGKYIGSFTGGNFTTVERALSSKYKFDYYYSNVYVDLDDTIIIDGKVNTELIAFLYQCKNKGKYIHIITRNFRPDAVLEYHNICTKLFHSFSIVPAKQKKSEYIPDWSWGSAIFIDDSFKERQDVYINCDFIPCFDVSEIAGLLE